MTWALLNPKKVVYRSVFTSEHQHCRLVLCRMTRYPSSCWWLQSYYPACRSSFHRLDNAKMMTYTNICRSSPSPRHENSFPIDSIYEKSCSTAGQCIHRRTLSEPLWSMHRNQTIIHRLTLTSMIQPGKACFWKRSYSKWWMHWCTSRSSSHTIQHWSSVNK